MIQVRARVTDNSSGVHRVRGRIGAHGEFELRLARGSRRDGVWVGSVPTAVMRQAKRVPVWVSADDRSDPGASVFGLSNGAVYSPDRLQQAGFSSGVTIGGGWTGRGPISPRRASAARPSTSARGDAAVIVLARLRDAGAGVRVPSPSSRRATGAITSSVTFSW